MINISNTDFDTSKVSIDNGVVGLTLSMDNLSTLAGQYQRLSLYNYINENYNLINSVDHIEAKETYIMVTDEAIRQMDKYDLTEEEAIEEAFEQLNINYEVCNDYDMEK